MRTKPQLVAEMLRTLHDEGVLPCTYGVAEYEVVKAMGDGGPPVHVWSG